MDQSPSQSNRATRSFLAYGAYAVALFASSVSTFGTEGVLAGVLIPMGWGYVFWSTSRPRALIDLSVVLILAGFLLSCVFMPPVEAREASRRIQCKNNMRQLSLALHNYHDVFGSFPPAYAIDAEGRPLYSWRVMVLPFLDQGPLYNLFRLDQPWDGPQNRDLAKSMPNVFACPSRGSGSGECRECTSYVAVVGDRTIWPDNGRATHIRDVKDGTSHTVLLIESHSRIPWTEPRDLSLGQALDELTSAESAITHSHTPESFLYENDLNTSRCIALADGSMRYARQGADRDTWSSLFLIDDGKPATAWELSSAAAGSSRTPRIGNWVRLAIFLIVSLFPLPWVWLSPNSGRDE